MPQYRLTLYRRDDPATVLSPRAGAVHSDPFRVSTERAPAAGWQPYLAAPVGRHGRLDPKTRHWASGEFTFRLLDMKVGADNTERWVSAFEGNADGEWQFKGCLAVAEVDYGDGAGWEPYFKGRVVSQSAPDPGKEGPVLALVVRDVRVEEYRTVFTGAPHRSVSYARAARLWPLGLPAMRGDGRAWNGNRARPHAQGGTWELSGGARIRGSGGAANKKAGRLRVVHALAALADVRMKVGDKEVCKYLRARVVATDDTEGHFYVSSIAASVVPGTRGYDDEKESPLLLDRDGNLVAFGVLALDPAHPQYQAFAFGGGSIKEVELYNYGPPSADAPILIDRVHPARLWRDLLDGKFGALDETTGEPTFETIPHSGFDTAETDGTYPHLRMLVESPADLQQWAVENIAQIAHLAARAGNDGSVYPVNMRLPASGDVAGIPTVGAGDYRAAEWEQGVDAISALDVVSVHHRETLALVAQMEEGLDVGDRFPVTLLERSERTDSFPSKLFTDLPSSVHRIHSIGIEPLTPGADDFGNWGHTWNDFYTAFLTPALEVVVDPYLERFGIGAATLRFESSAKASMRAHDVGDWLIVDVEPQPDPSTNRRGGNRLMQVVERQEAGGIMRWRLLDAGPNSVLTAPTLDNATLSGDRLSVPLTASSGDKTVFEVAFTLTSVSARPAEKSDLWTAAGSYDNSAFPYTLHVDRIPAGYRAWVRARATGGLYLPSDWTYPPNSYVDNPGEPRVGNIRLSFSDGNLTVTWEKNSDCQGVRIYYEFYDPATGATGTPDGSEDSAADAFSHTLAVDLGSNLAVRIGVEPWTGWTGSAVSGTAGQKVEIDSEIPSPSDENPFGTITASVDPNGSVGFSFSGNDSARSFAYKVQKGTPASDPAAATVVDARSGTLSGVLTIADGEKAYVSGWFYDEAAGAGVRSQRVLAVAEHGGITYPIDPTHPLADGEYVASIRKVLKTASDVVGLAQSFVFGFGAEAGEGGLPIDKIMSMPVFDPTGTIKIVDTAAREIRNIAFGAEVTDSGAREVNRMLAKAASADPDDARALVYFGGTTVEALKPGEAGANVTENRTANNVLTGGGRAVEETGANRTENRTANDVVTGGGRAVAQAGADKTSLNTAADTSAVNGTAASSVSDGTARALAGLFASTGKVQDFKVEQAALVDTLFSTEAIVDRLFAQNIWTQAIFSKLIAAGVVLFETAVGTDIIADTINSINLSAYAAVLGVITGGVIQNDPSSPTVAVRISGDFSIPGTVQRYIDFYTGAGSTGIFISHPALTLANNGTATFGGTVSATQFTGATARFTGGFIYVGPSGSAQARIHQDGIFFDNSGGSAIFEVGTDGTHGIIQTTDVNAQIQITAANALSLKGSSIPFLIGSTRWAGIGLSTTPGANESNWFLRIDGVEYRVKRDGAGFLYV